MSRIEIYTKPLCPYCFTAKKLLKQKGASFDEYSIWGRPERRREMLERAEGRHTVPQIFIDGVGIGGSDELHDLDREGRLDPMLAGQQAGGAAPDPGSAA